MGSGQHPAKFLWISFRWCLASSASHMCCTDMLTIESSFNEDSFVLDMTTSNAALAGEGAFIQMCASARFELFLANVIRWRWRRG